MTGVRAWLTVAHFASVVDAIFKVAGVIVALAAADFFLFRPNVELTTSVEAFVDLPGLQSSYAEDERSAPALVLGVAAEYNRRNAADLRTDRNTTRGELPATALCRRLPRVVEAVFDDADCSRPAVSLGRGRYYERLLLHRNANATSPLTPAALREALGRMAEVEYLAARCTLTNTGNATAANVRIRASDGFARRSGLANDPFSLAVGEEFDRTFETERGAYERDPPIQFGVDWARADAKDSTTATVIAGVLLVLLCAAVINDIRRSTKPEAQRSEAPAPR